MIKHTKIDPIKHVIDTEIGPLEFLFWDKDLVIASTPHDGITNEVDGVPMLIHMDMRSYDDGMTFVQQCYETSNSETPSVTNWKALQLHRVDRKKYASDDARSKVPKIILEVVAELLKNYNIRPAAAEVGRNNALVILENQLEEAENSVANIQQQMATIMKQEPRIVIDRNISFSHDITYSKDAEYYDSDNLVHSLFQRFEYEALHLPTGERLTKVLWAFSKSDVLELLNFWSINTWKYSLIST